MSKRPLFILFFIAIFLFLDTFVFIESHEQQAIKKGVWVSVFSNRKPLYSKQGIMRLISLCKKTGINEIYLQLYQSGNAYYNSKIADKSKYEAIVKQAGLDTVEFLLRVAKKHNIKVFAWLNLLSLGKNDKAEILKRFGTSVLTRDQYLRFSNNRDNKELDNYYLRENHIFLEPGDLRVQDYLISIVNEIITNYPLFSGVHLDYIRYPAIVPNVPGSRFNKFGLTYGYGQNNLERFKRETGIDPQNNLGEEGSLLWDNWKRKQVYNLVKSISENAKLKSPSLFISCAVIPGLERAYLSAFQDWPRWLQDGIVDYVVLMNYTRDEQFFKEITKYALSQRAKGKVFIGIGAFLFKDNPDGFREQYREVLKLGVDGVVIFSYDDLTGGIIKQIKDIQP